MTTRSMTRSMTKLQKKSDDDGDNDRISSLPRNLIDLIMERLPMRDIARTSVLSTKWRYVWAEHPYLVFDREFQDDIKRHKLSSEVSIDFASIVNRILLHHVGNIEQFIVETWGVPPEQHSDINLWLALACRRGVKILSLQNFGFKKYTIPSCVFSAPGLTELSLRDCEIKTKDSLVLACFCRLQSLTLDSLKLDSWVLTTPRLTSLKLVDCHGLCGFSLSAPKLESLIFRTNDDFNLIPYLMCTNITFASIYTYTTYATHDSDSDSDSEDLEIIVSEINLLKLFNCWPNLTTFVLNEPALKHLTTGIALENLSFTLNLRWFRVFNISGDQIVWVLCILRNSPWLQKFQCSLKSDSKEDLEVLKYLNEPSIMNQRMEQLHTVNLRFFQGSKYELLLVKILLHCSPSLKQMVLEEFYSKGRVRILKELLRFPRACTNAEITFGNRSPCGKW